MNKVIPQVLVTGGSKGIGLAIAIKFAQNNYRVFITASRDKVQTQNALVAIKQNGKYEPAAFDCNVAEELSIQKLFKDIKDQNGYLNVVVNSAGISPNTDFLMQTAEEWNQVLQVNLTGSFLVGKYALPLMQGKYLTHKSIVLIGSSNGYNSFDPISAHYDTSKAGVFLLARNMAKAYASYDIRVNVIAPGWIETSMNDTLSEDFQKSETEKIYMKRWGKPEEVANACYFLCSPEASFINGTSLLVDGGYG